MKVAHAYGMIQPGASDTSAVRSTFFIDDKSVLRAMVYYPMRRWPLDTGIFSGCSPP